MKKQIFSIVTASLFAAVSIAQENRLGNRPESSSAIYHKMEKLGFLGSALFIAAHPDDENTRMISWLDNKKMARTAYLSLTRGDGGQNLIGPELREQLGMIRTQELLEARNIDGGEQFFTRANDFGYSKHPDETLEIWNKDQVLSDVVQVIRKFQPDIIINRFDHRSPGTTHGHHTSSAILAVEAFDLVNDPTAYPEQLKTVDVWQPQRQFFNTSWWFYGSRDAFAKADKTNLLEIETGDFFTSSGYSNGEIAALSRSRHQSQGFGSSGSRGSSTEYLEFLKGSFPTDKSDPFSGINTTWSRIDKSGKLESAWNKLLADFDFKNPAKSVSQLLLLKKELEKLPDSYWKNIKLAETKGIILDVSGIYLNASTGQSYATAGEMVNVAIEVTNRSLEQLNFNVSSNNQLQIIKNSEGKLLKNKSDVIEAKLTIPEGQKATTPYYLESEGTLGMYEVENKNLIGLPETDAAFTTTIDLIIDGERVSYKIPVIFKTTDRVRGEIYEPFNVVPDASVSIENPVYIFQKGIAQDINVKIKAFKSITKANLVINLPDGWNASPATLAVTGLATGVSKDFTIKIIPGDKNPEVTLSAALNYDSKSLDQEVILIDYNHIPNQQLIKPATAKLVNPGLQNLAQTVAYINGAGDDVAQAIEAIGSKVFKYDPSDVPADLSKYDAIMVGIRAFNVAPQEMANLQSRLNAYVENGGTLIMQYNTNRGISNDALGPLDISLSRQRVTDENAPVTFLNPDLKILNSPNPLSAADFENWVQERGLYFPTSWDPAFTPVLGMADKGESQTTGSLLVAKYGKGNVVYTGLSLFRELPAGVSGAYKLLANMISLSKNQPNIETKQDNKF